MALEKIVPVLVALLILLMGALFMLEFSNVVEITPFLELPSNVGGH